MPEFAYANNGRKFSRTDERGVPIFDDKGKRKLYTRQEGLSWLCLSRNLNLGSGGDDLGDSSSDGRVVEKSAEGASQKISAPTLEQILKYSKKFVPQAAFEEFEGGLKGIYKSK